MSTRVATLFCKQGSSDKTYQLQMVPKGKGYLINFQYGPRGGTLVGGTKTLEPLPEAEAEKIYLKLLKEKAAKGYTEGEGGTPYQNTDLEARVTGLLPQLLNNVEETELQPLFRSFDWMAQEKFDGDRRMVRRTKDGIIGANRRGLEVPLATAIATGLSAIPVDFVIDAEDMGDYLAVFDLLQYDQEDLRGAPAIVRITRLEHHFAGIAAIQVVKTAFDMPEKRTLFVELKKRGAEGIVFKRCASPYVVGRPNAGGAQLKYKFYAEATVQVDQVNAGKRSVSMLVYSDEGVAVPVGSVTVPANQQVPAPGAFIEVRYLYAYPAGSLFQPYLKGIRRDVTAAECKRSQLKYKEAMRCYVASKLGDEVDVPEELTGDPSEPGHALNERSGY